MLGDDGRRSVLAETEPGEESERRLGQRRGPGGELVEETASGDHLQQGPLRVLVSCFQVGDPHLSARVPMTTNPVGDQYPSRLSSPR